MKKLIAIIAALALVPLAPLAANAEEETRQFQYSKTDKSTPKGISVDFDITELQMGITTDDEYQFYAKVKGLAEDRAITDMSFIELFIDNNLDKKTDYRIKVVPFVENGLMVTAQLLDMADQPVVKEGCDVYFWATSDNDFWGFEISKACIPIKSDINVSVRSTFESRLFDLVPDKGAWQKFTTKYMKAALCNSGEKNKKVTYDGTTYICMKSGSKWAWRDYAPIAAKNAKWLTEKAYYSCKLNTKFGASIEDGGKTLTLDGAYLYFITEKDYLCVTRMLKMPGSVERRVGMTRALDGVQEARWGSINAFWNYHPDSGLNITFSYN
jgi:hypothetical protein